MAWSTPPPPLTLRERGNVGVLAAVSAAAAAAAAAAALLSRSRRFTRACSCTACSLAEFRSRVTAERVASASSCSCRSLSSTSITDSKLCEDGTCVRELGTAAWRLLDRELHTLLNSTWWTLVLSCSNLRALVCKRWLSITSLHRTPHHHITPPHTTSHNTTPRTSTSAAKRWMPGQAFRHVPTSAPTRQSTGCHPGGQAVAMGRP